MGAHLPLYIDRITGFPIRVFFPREACKCIFILSLRQYFVPDLFSLFKLLFFS